MLFKFLPILSDGLPSPLHGINPPRFCYASTKNRHIFSSCVVCRWWRCWRWCILLYPSCLFFPSACMISLFLSTVLFSAQVILFSSIVLFVYYITKWVGVCVSDTVFTTFFWVLHWWLCGRESARGCMFALCMCVCSVWWKIRYYLTSSIS